MSKFIEYATKLIQYCESKEMNKLNALLSDAEEYFLVTKEYDKIMKLYLEVQAQMEDMGNVDLIVEYMIRFLIFYEDLDIDSGRFHYLSSQGYLHYILCDYENALKCVQLALVDAEKNKNLVSRIVITRNIAMLYIKLGDIENALKMVHEAELLIDYDVMDNWYFQSSVMLTHAECLINQKKYPEAKIYLDDVIKTESYNNSIQEQMEYCHMLAMYYFGLGNYEKSLEHYKQAIGIAEKHNLFYEYENMYLGIAKVLFKLEFIEESQVYKEKADAITIDLLDQANRSIMHKVNISIELEEKLKRAKRKQKFEDLPKKLDLNKFDELTEVLSKSYLFNQLNDSFLDIKDDNLPQLLVISIDNVHEIIDNSMPIFGDKYIYEISKILNSNDDDYTLGRIADNKFMLVFSSNNNVSISDEIKWLFDNLNKTVVEIKDKNYNIIFSHTFIDLEKYKKENMLTQLDMYTIVI